MIGHTRTLSAAALAAALIVGGVGCTPAPTTRVTIENESAPATGTLTAIQRGQIRRDALAVARTGINAWLASDADGMSKVFDKSIMDSFDKNWATWAKRGLSVKHVHESVYMDMIDLNEDCTQALVTYRYNDTSYLVNSAGKKAESLPAFKEKEIQFTLELADGKWKVVRAIAGPEAYR